MFWNYAQINLITLSGRERDTDQFVSIFTQFTLENTLFVFKHKIKLN